MAINKICKLEQAKKLKELGFHNDVLHFYKDDGVLHELEYFDREWSFGISSILDNCNYYKGKYNAPYIHEALEWFREVKGVHCSVILSDYFDGSVRYTGRYLIDVYSGWITKETTYYYESHSEAESALLDALIEYVK